VLVFVLLTLGLRLDFATARHEFGFPFATVAALGLLVSASFLAFTLAIPGRDISSLARRGPQVFLGLFLLVLFFQAVPAGQHFNDGLALSGLHCSVAVFFLGLIPGLLALLALRRLAPVYPAATAGAWGMAMGAAGALGICFHCPAHNAVHLIVYHALPVVLLAALARGVGQKILRW